MPGTIKALELRHENVQGCSETLQSLLTQEHLLALTRKRDTLQPLVSRWALGFSSKGYLSGGLAGLGPEEELEVSVVASNTHPTPEIRRSTRQGCSCAPRTTFPPSRQGLLEVGGGAPHTPISPGCRGPEAAGNGYPTSSSCTTTFPLNLDRVLSSLCTYFLLAN